MASNNLNAARIAAGQANAYITSNDADNALDSALTEVVDVTVVGNVSISATTLASAVTFRLQPGASLAAAFIVSLPASVKRGNVTFVNATAYTATVQVSGQTPTPLTIAAGVTSLVNIDGIEARLAGGGGGGGGSIEVYEGGTLISASPQFMAFSNTDFDLVLTGGTQVDIALSSTAKGVTVSSATTPVVSNATEIQFSSGDFTVQATGSTPSVSLKKGLNVQEGGVTVDANSFNLNFDATNFNVTSGVAGTANVAIASVPATLAFQEGGTAVVSAGTVNFNANDFDVSDVSGVATVSLNGLRPYVTPSFMGAFVNKTVNETVNYSATATVLSFDAETYDTSNFHDNVTNNSRLVIPANMGITKVRLSANIFVTSLTVGTDVFAQFLRNGVSFLGSSGITIEQPNYTDGGFVMTSPVIPVVDGDYFEIRLRLNGDTSVVIEANRTAFSLEVVEVSGTINLVGVQSDSGTARTLTASDVNNHVTFNSASTVTVTVPTDAAQSIPIGSTIALQQTGSGQVDVVASAGVTLINPQAPATASTRTTGSVVFVRKLGANLWTVYGDLA